MYNIIYRFLLVLVLFLILGIICKSNLNYRNKIHYYLYEDNLVFSTFRDFYNKYLGDVFPLNYIGNDTIVVFSEKIKYSSISKYLDGYSLDVGYNYLVPIISDGIVTYVGEKKNYGNVIIVMGNDGVNIWYGNIKNSNFKLYDSVSSGDFVGEVCNDKLYLVFNDGDEYLDYSYYLQ